MEPREPTPERIYGERLAVRRAAASRLERRARRVSFVRLGIFATGAVMAWPIFVRGDLAWPWLFLPLAAFIGVAVWHDRLLRRLVRTQRAVAFYERGIARLEHRWVGNGATGERFLHPDHPYAADLDVFGRGSMFELISGARTATGEERLADWLSRPASAAQARARQAAVDELRPRLDLRESLAVLGQEVEAEVHPQGLLEWAEAAPRLVARWPAWVALVLGVSNFVTVTAWFATEYFVRVEHWDGRAIGPWPFLVSAFASTLFVAWLRRPLDATLEQVNRPAYELQVLSELMSVLEGCRFDCDLLRERAAALDRGSDAPSRRIARLARLVEINDSRHNLVFKPFAALALLGVQIAHALERWRSRSGGDVAVWVSTVAELEALCSLAGYAYEHPADPFPSILDEGRRFDGRGLRHPLIPTGCAVDNDVTLDDGLRLLLVSGSNMSGKSTLLRTVGLNAVLAFAGAPVSAQALSLSPLQVGACMRVQDSLQAGLSHFYAEIRRLRSLVDLAGGGRPLLFLLDEVLHGTNSHDRLIGASALVRGLVESGNLGLVTTHDLALARIVDELDGRAANVHFADHLEDDRVTFDYRLSPGVVRKSNALALMRAVGLKV